MCIVSAMVAGGMMGAGAAAGSAGAGLLTGVTAFQAAAMDLSLVGMGMSAVGSYQQTEQANAQARYQSQVMTQNAEMAEEAAREDKYQGYLNSEAQKRKTMQVVGAQRAAEGASGAVVDDGSFMDVTLDTVERGTLDALALQHQGDVQAWKDRVQGANYTNQANLYSAASERDPLLPVGGSLLSGAGQIGMNWYRMNNGFSTTGKTNALATTEP